MSRSAARARQAALPTPVSTPTPPAPPTPLQEALQTLVRLVQRFEFNIDGAMNAAPPALRPGITLGYRDGLWCRVRERPGAAAAAAARA
jgi:hypothetical protein